MMSETIPFDNAIKLIKDGVIIEFRHKTLDEYDEHTRDQLTTNWKTWLSEFQPDWNNPNVEWRIKHD